MSSNFLELAVNTGVTRNHIRQKSKTAAGQVGVSGADIKSAPVPVPPLEEQLAIVEMFRSKLGQILALGSHAESVASSQERLERAILASAFDGRLLS